MADNGNAVIELSPWMVAQLEQAIEDSGFEGTVGEFVVTVLMTVIDQASSGQARRHHADAGASIR